MFRKTYTKPKIIQHLKHEFEQSQLKSDHEVAIIEGGTHNLVSTIKEHTQQKVTKIVITKTLAFLEKHLDAPDVPQKPTGY